MASTMIPSFSESIYAMPSEGATVVMVPKQSTGGCAIAGIVMFIVVIALVVWLIVIFTRPGDTVPFVAYNANTHVGDQSAKPATTETVHELKSGAKDGIVMFYAAWCQHCTAMRPTFDEFAKERGMGDVYKMDCSETSAELTQLLNLIGVHGFPQVVMFKGGTPKVHKGRRTKDALRSFAEQ